MYTHPPVLLDLASSLRDAATTLFNDLFSPAGTAIALVLTIVLAGLGWLIAYFILRHKETCSMVCTIHFSSVILTIIAGIIGGFGLIDLFKGSLITGAGLALLVLTVPIFILVESFNYVVLSNKHARHHRDLRTRADKRVRRYVVFLTPLGLGLILAGVGLLVGDQVGPTDEVIILLVTLWVLALAAEVIFLLTSGRRRRKLAALPSGSALDQQQLAALWASGINSYRIGRGRTEAIYWEEFTERVIVTEELLLEEEGELNLVEVEEQETVSYAAVSAVTVSGAAVAAGPGLHRQHRLQRRRPAHRFWRRWGNAILLVVLSALALAVCVVTGVSALIALAFLAPAIYLIVYRFRRDSEVHFVTETAEKVNTVQAALVVAGSRTTVSTEEAVVQRPASANPPGLRPARPTPVIPPATPPLIMPKEEPEPPTLPSAEVAEQASQEAVSAGAAHENPDIANETALFPGRDVAVAAAAAAAAAGAAHENPDIADDTLLIAHTPATPAAEETLAAEETEEKLTDTQFSSFFAGAVFPANRSHLLEQARKNRAPQHLIAWLETLATTVTIVSLIELRRRYRTRRAQKSATAVIEETTTTTETVTQVEKLNQTQVAQYFEGASYPATRDQILAAATKNNVPRYLILWLEEVDESYTFTSVTEVYYAYTVYTCVRGVHYPATRDQVMERAIANNAPRTVILWLETITVTTVFVSITQITRSYVTSITETTTQTEELSQTQVEQQFEGANYPATRDEILAVAAKNNAPKYLIVWLEEIDESYTFTTITEVYYAYTVYTYVRGVHYPATREQIIERAVANNAPRTVLVWLETITVTIVFVSITQITRSYITYVTETVETHRAVDIDEAPTILAPKKELGIDEAPAAPAPQQEVDIDEAPTIIAPRRRSVKITRNIGIIEFQHYLHGIDYPATKEQLLAQARQNNAPPNMISRLEELEEHYRFLNVSDVMLGYAYHRYLRGVHFPASRADLLEHARSNDATPKLITRLEALDEQATFNSLEDVLRRSHEKHAVEEVDEEDEEELEDNEADEETITLPPTPTAPIKVDSRIRITEFQHYLKGIKYPAARAELLAQARQNNAPPNMIARLEELPERHRFKSASEVMRGYAHEVQDEEQEEQ